MRGASAAYERKSHPLCRPDPAELSRDAKGKLLLYLHKHSNQDLIRPSTSSWVTLDMFERRRSDYILSHTWKTSELHSASRNSSSHSCSDDTSGASHRDDDFVPFVGKICTIASIAQAAFDYKIGLSARLEFES